MLGRLAQFQTAINPEGYPGGTYVTPVSLPSFTSFNRYNEFALYANDNWSIGNRVTVNLGIRYEYYGPQTKSEPKFDSNFYYGDPNVSVNSSSPAEHRARHRDRRTCCPPMRARSARCGSPTGTTGRRVSDSRGT